MLLLIKIISCFNASSYKTKHVTSDDRFCLGKPHDHAACCRWATSLPIHAWTAPFGTADVKTRKKRKTRLYRSFDSQTNANAESMRA